MAEFEKFYQNIFASLVDGILIISDDLKIIMVNQASEEIFQRSKDSFEGLFLEELFPDQPKVIGNMHQAVLDGAPYHHIEAIGFRKSNNGHFPANLTFSPIIKGNDERSTGIILIKDNTFTKELLEDSQQVEYLSTLRNLSAGMAHEIRNPLSSIRGSAQLLLKDLQDSNQREYIEIVIAEVDRINRLVTKMMDLAHPSSENFNPTNIHQVLEEILVLESETLKRKKGKFIQAYDPSLPTIEANKDELKQVFLNLVKNAVEASFEGGQVTITTEFNNNYTLRKKNSSLLTSNIVIKIADSGVGMNEKIKKNLFTPFFTTKKRGTGLGMMISLKIIESHSGKIKVTSKENIGTVVQVFLPVNRK
jgi:two-component system, NtrC family, nitrogen regulation sensor histidine kinase GlnL